MSEFIYYITRKTIKDVVVTGFIDDESIYERLFLIQLFM